MPSRPRIIGVVTAGNRRDEKAWEALADCDLAEFRADTMMGPEAAGTAALADRLREFRDEGARRLGRVPDTLVTLRLRRDGGSWPDEKSAERESLLGTLRAGAGRPCEWVDLEVEEVARFSPALRRSLEAAGVKVLVSHHNFQGTYALPAFRERLAAMGAAKPDGVKFAVTCRTRSELRDLLAFAREAARDHAHSGVFSMGGPGRCTRVLAPLLGCPFTYGYLSGGAVAPGQLSAAELRAFFAGAPFPPTDDTETLIEWADGRLQEAGLAS